ncbi:XamI family restriction endonuclease [Halomonas denitrificans]|nr:XamI family restriction endonuclease [Halomonas denitrificans]
MVEEAAKYCEEAKAIYIDSQINDSAVDSWYSAKRAERRQISEALRLSNGLLSIPLALETDGRTMRVFRHLCAPPISQDQFLLLCPTWSKASEKSGVGLQPDVAKAAESVLIRILDKSLCPWVEPGIDPSWSQLKRLQEVVCALMASQSVATERRKALASEQEQLVIEALMELGWSQIPSKKIESRGDVDAKKFMHKTRFATKTRPKEVDVACGLGNTKMLALECKVTNDATNSVKRINDVLTKATSWREHWGSFVVTGAFLQGVISEKDVERLVEADVVVFWSHRLQEFRDWVGENCE